MRYAHVFLIWPILRGICLPTPQEGGDPTALDSYYSEEPKKEQDPLITGVKDFVKNVVIPGVGVGGLYSHLRNPNTPRFQSKWHRPGTWGIGRKIKNTAQTITETPGKIKAKAKETSGNVKKMPGQLKAEIKDLPGQVKKLPGATKQLTNNVVEWPGKQVQNRRQKQAAKEQAIKDLAAKEQAAKERAARERAFKETRRKTPTEELLEKNDEQLKEEMTSEEREQWEKCVQTKINYHKAQNRILLTWGDEHTGRAVNIPEKDLNIDLVEKNKKAECTQKHRQFLLNRLFKEMDAKTALERAAKEGGTTETGGAPQTQEEKQKVPAGVNAFQAVQGFADTVKDNFIRVVGAAAKVQPGGPVGAPMPQGPARIPKFAAPLPI